MDELIKSQKEILGINDFLDEAKIYTKDVIGKVDLDKSLDSILSGDIAYDWYPDTHLPEQSGTFSGKTAALPQSSEAVVLLGQ